MTIFYIKVEMIDGLRMMTGCTESKEYAETQWGLGKYAKVLADNAHEVKAESIKQGITDAVTSSQAEETVECKMLANATAKKAFRPLLKGAAIEKEDMSMGIKVDKAANWKLHTNQAPAGFEMIGVVKKGVETGALARNLSTGIYVMVNASVLQSLPQKAVASVV